MNSTRIEHRVNASREAVYRALIDPDAIARWKVPRGITCTCIAFDAVHSAVN